MRSPGLPYFLSIGLLTLLPFLSFGHEVYKGRVVDARTQEPLQGATILAESLPYGGVRVGIDQMVADRPRRAGPGRELFPGGAPKRSWAGYCAARRWRQGRANFPSGVRH